MRERIAVGWAGMRGAISLAAALAVPTEVAERPEILLLTFGVILVTLLGQGLTLPLLLRALRAARARTAGRPTRRRCGWSPPRRRSTGSTSSRRRARRPSRCAGCASSTASASRCASRCSAAASCPRTGAGELRDYGAMRRELIAVERATLLRAAQRRARSAPT